MGRRTEQYGETLIGPPAFAEYFSVGLEKLLLSRGSEDADQICLMLPAAEGLPAIKINDYRNDAHIDFPNAEWSTGHREMRKIFYASGSIAIIGVTPMTPDQGLKRAPGELSDFFHVYRPKDIDPENGLGTILLRGLPAQIIESDQLVIAVMDLETANPVLMPAPGKNPYIKAIINQFEN